VQVALIDDVAAWLCATVITAHGEGGAEQALRILCKWIRVGYHLKELRSFNMFFAVMFGVQSLDKYETDDSTLLIDLLADFEDEDAEAYACVSLSALCARAPTWLLPHLI
jgi:hypothetical protein